MTREREAAPLPPPRPGAKHHASREPAIQGLVAGLMSWDSMRSQGYASINRAEIRFDDQGKPSVDLYGGKEQGQIEIRYVHQPDGGTMAEYKAADVRAFDGQVIRGAVEQAISADVKEVAPGIVESVTGAVICAVTKLGC